MPSKTIDQRWETAKPTIIEAAKAAGIDVEIMVKISGFESGYNPSARPVARDDNRNTVTQFDGVKAISSAHGYGQFLNGTWQDMVNKYGEKYGVENSGQLSRTEANAPELRNNVALQAAMLAEFTKENINKGARLGGLDADANVYAFHNLGDGDATVFLKVMKTNPEQRVDQVLAASVIRGNPALYGDGCRSLAESYKAMGQKMDNYEKYALDARQGIANLTTSPVRIFPVQNATSNTASNQMLPNNRHLSDALLINVANNSEPRHVKKSNEHGSQYPHFGGSYVKGIPPLEPQINISAVGRGVNSLRDGDNHPDFESRFNEKNNPENADTSNLNRLSMSDGILKKNEHGPEIAVLQTKLNALGFKDAQGKPLVPDGDFGERTKQAVQAFQGAHHLDDDGIVGRRTFAELKKSQSAANDASPSLAIDKKDAPLLSNPNHPDYALYKQALTGMEKLPAPTFKSIEERQNAAATVVFEAKVSGLSKIDTVALSTNGNGLFAVQGGMSDPAHHRVYVDKAQAAAKPIEKSTQQLQQEHLLPVQSMQVPEQQKKVMMV